LFWESLNGIQYRQKDKHHFRTVGCLFNSNAFYANIQVRDDPESIQFKLNDITQWKYLQHHKRKYTPTITLTRMKILISL
jgi:hypothetical protein